MTLFGNKISPQRFRPQITSKAQSWHCPLSFFNKNKAHYFDPVSNKTHLFFWKFSNGSPHRSPVQIVRCHLYGFGIQSQGYGDGFTLKGAIIRAFSEAWERLWFKRCHQSNFLLNKMPLSSNGFAAGKTNTSAMNHSKNELIERALLLRAWECQQGWQTHTLKSYRAKLLVAFLEWQGWKPWFYQLKNMALGKVLVIICHHPDKGSFCDSTYSDTDTQAEIKLLRSVLCYTNTSQTFSFSHLTQSSKPKDHQFYYQNPDNQKAFHFLKSLNTENIEIVLNNPSSIRTLLISKVSAFPAVAYSFHPQWPDLVWGTQSIRGKNPWPHPLA